MGVRLLHCFCLNFKFAGSFLEMGDFAEADCFDR